MPTSWNTVILTFCLIFATNERIIVSGKAFYTVFWGSPLICGNKRNTDQWASTKHRMEGLSLHNSSLIGHKNQGKFENDCISRNGHRIKITQPNLMILVSFSSVEDALSNDVKNILLAHKVLKICCSAFLGTPGIEMWSHRHARCTISSQTDS